MRDKNVRIENTIIINRPLEAVFQFMVTDYPQTAPKVSHDTIGIRQIPEGEVKVGTQYQRLYYKQSSYVIASSDKDKELRHTWQNNPEAGISGEVTEVIEYEPGKKVIYSSESAETSGTFQFSFNPVGTATEVRMLADITIKMSALDNQNTRSSNGDISVGVRFPKFLIALIAPASCKIAFRNMLKKYKTLLEKDLLLPDKLSEQGHQ